MDLTEGLVFLSHPYINHSKECRIMGDYVGLDKKQLLTKYDPLSCLYSVDYSRGCSSCGTPTTNNRVHDGGIGNTYSTEVTEGMTR